MSRGRSKGRSRLPPESPTWGWFTRYWDHNWSKADASPTESPRLGNPNKAPS